MPWSAEAITALRRRMGLSQAEFAHELGVRQQTVSEWETGKYIPRGASARLLGIVAETQAPYDAAPDGSPRPPGEGAP